MKVKMSITPSKGRVGDRKKGDPLFFFRLRPETRDEEQAMQVIEATADTGTWGVRLLEKKNGSISNVEIEFYPAKDC